MTVTGTISPTPAVAVGGVTVAAGPDPDGSWPAVMALSGVSVKWGRADVLTQPKPATATVELFDPAGTWAASQDDLIGQPLTLSWTWAGADRVYFAGRVAAVDLERHTARRPDGNRVHGARVTLSATSLLADLGNRKAPYRFTESLSARRDALAVVCAGPVSSIATPADWDPAQLFADDGTGTALAALDGLYDSLGATRYTWDPDSRAVTGLGRRAYPNPGSLVYLTRASGRTGVFLTAPGGWIDGDAVVYSGGASKDQASRLTRAQVTYSALNTEGTGREAATIVRPIPGVDETVVGERAVSVTTAFMDSGWAGTAADALAAFAAGEAAGWRLEPMRWDTARTGGGFETIAQAQLLLAGCESPDVVFLAGTWLPDLGVRPVFGVMGGTITYASGAWSVTWQPAPIGVTGPEPAPVTWDDLDPSITWDEDSPTGFHDSVTYEDLTFLSSGAITIGA